MLRNGYKGGKVSIDHVMNPEAAEKVKALVKEQFPDCDFVINTCKGLCSHYAERYGYIIGYEC
jgi:hypothetical protein